MAGRNISGQRDLGDVLILETETEGHYFTCISNILYLFVNVFYIKEKSGNNENYICGRHQDWASCKTHLNFGFCCCFSGILTWWLKLCTARFAQHFQHLTSSLEMNSKRTLFSWLMNGLLVGIILYLCLYYLLKNNAYIQVVISVQIQF